MKPLSETILTVTYDLGSRLRRWRSTAFNAVVLVINVCENLHVVRVAIAKGDCVFVWSQITNELSILRGELFKEVLPVGVLQGVFSIHPERRVCVIRHKAKMRALVRRVIINTLIVSPSSEGRCLYPTSIVMSNAVNGTTYLHNQFY